VPSGLEERFAVRLPAAVCAVVGEIISTTGTHPTLNLLFQRAGAPGQPPELSHRQKWKHWLQMAGDDPKVDALKVLALVIEEFMDVAPSTESPEFQTWQANRQKIVNVLEEYGLRYYRGGRVLPNGAPPPNVTYEPMVPDAAVRAPGTVQELLLRMVRGLPRAMHPLTHRRKGASALSFQTEYDVQDLLHAMLRPWVADIRPEEFTPSYAGSSTRMDFLLPDHRLVLELKFVRDRQHSRKVGDELIVDIEHYRRHPDCNALWCVIYDPNHFLTNAAGLSDLEGTRSMADGKVEVRVIVVSA